ncbi:MAG: sigma-54-dependent Fis family transcriptional regulator, partial [Acidobacteria bacterium]|nr:sigma-54-dependent Fis family transcriptional regulator [Acidobacteriota bacterium]
LTEAVHNMEKRLILKSLEKTAWNKQKAAELLKVKRTTLIEKIKKIQEEE